MFLSGLTLDNIYPEENNLIAYRHKIDNSFLASRKYGLEGYYINMHKFNILLNSIIEVSAKTKLDLCLWTETDKNTQYFERHGFESKGKVGQNKENLMIRYIDR